VWFPEEKTGVCGWAWVSKEDFPNAKPFFGQLISDLIINPNIFQCRVIADTSDFLATTAVDLKNNGYTVICHPMRMNLACHTNSFAPSEPMNPLA